MKFLARLFIIIILLCGLSGCSTETPAVYSAGTAGPKLEKPLSQNPHILALAVLSDIKIDVISENIFTYRKLGTTTVEGALVNAQLSKTMAATLKNMNYPRVDSASINSSNVLNTTDVQATATELTPAAQQFLAQQLHGRGIDTVVLITQDGNQPLAFDLKCELSKNSTYNQASIEPHLYLYKIYIIDAHTLKILTWITSNASGNLHNTHLCKPPTYFSAENFNELNEIVTSGLNTAVTASLNQIFIYGGSL